MSRKKRLKAQDFKKIKLKAGKRLPKHLNETRPEFKSKRIQINPTIESIDPVKLLSNISINTNRKLVYLTKLNEKYSSSNCEDNDDSLLKDGEQIQVVCKYLTDPDHRVRTEVLKFLKNYFNVFEKCLSKSDNAAKTSPTLAIILSFVSCGITHINPNIRRDAEKLLSFIIDQSTDDSGMDEQLMKLFITKINSSQFESLDYDYYSLLKRFISSICKRKESQFHVKEDLNKIQNSGQMKNATQVFIWNSANQNVIDLKRGRYLDELFCNQDSTGFNLTFLNLQQNQTGQSSSNINKMFMERVHSMVAKDIQLLIGNGQHQHRTISIQEADKLINALEIIIALSANVSVGSDSHYFLDQYWPQRTAKKQQSTSEITIPTVNLMMQQQQKSNNKKSKIMHITKDSENKRLLKQLQINRLLKKFKNQILSL